MGVPWHWHINLDLSSRSNDRRKGDEVLLNISQSIPQPEPYTSPYLITTTPASMQLPCNASTDDLTKPVLVGCV
jgi:hypothetical protein